MANLLLSFAVSFGLLMLVVTVHEFAHGWTAFKLGDMTAKYSGSGAAKPVPINYWSLKNPKRDIIWVGASGPLANFIFALGLSVLWKLLPPASILSHLFKNLIVINVVLGVFNLIPIPPLDGSRILMGVLPHEISIKYTLIEPYGFIILMLLVWLGIFGYIIWPIVDFILKLLGVSL